MYNPHKEMIAWKQKLFDMQVLYFFGQNHPIVSHHPFDQIDRPTHTLTPKKDPREIDEVKSQDPAQHLINLASNLLYPKNIF